MRQSLLVVGILFCAGFDCGGTPPPEPMMSQNISPPSEETDYTVAECASVFTIFDRDVIGKMKEGAKICPPAFINRAFNLAYVKCGAQYYYYWEAVDGTLSYYTKPPGSPIFPPYFEVKGDSTRYPILTHPCINMYYTNPTGCTKPADFVQYWCKY